MSEKKKMELITICYDKEVEALKLQIRSVVKFFKDKDVIDYTVVWNDEKPQPKIDRDVAPALMRELGDANLSMRVLARESFAAADVWRPHKGRRTQQVLKLLTASATTAEFALMLDAKNHFISDLHASDFVSSIGKPYTFRQNYAGSGFQEFVAGSCRVFNVPVDDAILTQAYPTTTPNLLCPSVVQKLIKYVESGYKNDFASTFLSHPVFDKTTEFLLYYAAILKFEGSIQQLYEVTTCPYVTFFRTGPSGEANIKRSIETVMKGKVKILGLHPGRIPNLTPPEKAMFEDVWLRAGLFKTREDVLRFLT